ncbi:hypothetical protein [Pelagicoccus sp. SDUM812003]|uniref:hypothetical protein n=1 Tax=Pelagicoccus sp. SDUM812003 TaxID=3041267 RepID=UPI00280C818C|nr:hypothetical protein [Pelagicoccus sp. SDUM812003]MDQ8204871.1 hypothetical protein [Pelagicoccus sp. SDUM812003]
MSVRAGKRRFGRTLRWTVACSFALLFHLALYWSVSLTMDSNRSLRRETRQFTEIRYLDQETTEESDLLTQRMTLFDPRPLLLPTRWNASNARYLTNTLEEEGAIFTDFSPMFELEDGNYVDDFGIAAANYDRLSLAQVNFDLPLFHQLGRTEFESDYQQEEGALLTLTDPGTGREISQTFIYSNEIASLTEQWPAWGIATFMAVVEKSFLVGGLSVLESSGFDEVDQRLRGIAKSYFPDLKQLEDGVYLLQVVP